MDDVLARKKENYLEEICNRFPFGNSRHVGTDDRACTGQRQQERPIGDLQRLHHDIQETSQENEEVRRQREYDCGDPGTLEVTRSLPFCPRPVSPG